MKKTFRRITITITTVLVIFSLAYTSISPAKTAVADIETIPAVTEWQLNVTGLVENPLNLSWSEIFAKPKTSVDAAIICVDFPETVVTKGNWTGVKLRTLLEEAKPSGDVIKVAFYANDGYSTDLSLSTAMQDNIIIAYEKDGTPLNDLRLVVPNKWGYKWIRQLSTIELINYNFTGYWEGVGYSDEANIEATSTPDSTPEPFAPSLPNITAPSPQPTPPETSPSSTPYSSPPSVTSPVPFQPTPEPSGGMSTTADVVYTIVASVVIAVLTLALLFVRKRK